MSTKKIIELTVKEVTGSISTKESKKLENLINQSEKNRKVYSDTLKTWNKSGEYSVKLSINEESSWESFNKKTKQEPIPKLLTLHPAYKIAATILITIGVGLSVFNLWEPTEYETKLGETLEVILDDESVITLNELSSIVVSKSFNKKDRKIDFLGEAYFEIAENPDKPFIINSKDSEVRVLGTSFNIDAKKGTQLVKVDVTSGRVLLSEVENQSNQVVLTKGMNGSFSVSTRVLITSQIESQNFLAWRTNTLEFDDLKMPQVLTDIEEYFGEKLTITNQQMLNCNFTSSFSDPTIEEVLDILTLTLDLSYAKEDEQYVLSGVGCTEIQE